MSPYADLLSLLHRWMLVLSGPKVLLMTLLLCLSGCSSRIALSSGSEDNSFSQEASTRKFAAASLENIRGNHRKASNLYLQLLREQPDNAALNYALSKTFFSLGAVDSARIYAEKSVSLDPSNKYYLGSLAVLSHQMNDFARAAILFRQLADLEPGSTEALAMLALEYLSADDPEKALGVFEEILKNDPKNETTRTQVLLMQIQLNRYRDAIGTLSGFTAQGNREEKLRLTLGELYIKTRQYDMAKATLGELVRNNPGFIPAWLLLLDVSVQSGKGGIFRDDLDRFYGTKEISVKLKSELSNIFLVRSLRDSLYTAPADLMVSEMRRLYPRSGEVHLLSGRAEIQKKKPLQAEVYLRKAMLFSPSDVDVREELVNALMMQKNYSLARTELSRAIKRMPAMKRRLTVLEGQLSYRSGAIGKAAALLEKTLRWREITKEKWLFLQAAGTLAFCYDQLGMSVKSIRLYERILEVDPGNHLMMNNLAYILALEGKELGRAMELSLKVTRAEPANPGYLDTLGWIYFRLGEYAKAREILEKAYSLDPEEPEILEHLGSAYEKLGNAEKAKELRERAEKLRSG